MEVSTQIRRKAEDLQKTFFWSGAPIQTCTCVIQTSSFFFEFIVCDNGRGNHRTRWDFESNLISDLDLRRTAVEFGRCFISGSIAGLVFRQERSSFLASEVIPILMEFSNCTHMEDEIICTRCISNLKSNAKRISAQLPAASRMFRALCDASIYQTGQLFPGHPMVRPSIDFGRSARNENESKCRKDYRASDTHSPGIFTVQCVCRYPKVIGVSVMDECEGTSTAMSILLSRFKSLPRVCYYDNSCNLAKSIILRTPWVNEKCLVVSDRFHYRGHKCNVVNDPDSYPACRMHSTSGAESINQHWNFSKSHVRFLSADNLMPFLAIRTVFLNIRARIREKFGVMDIDDSHYSKYIQEAWVCCCNLCLN